MAAEPPELTYPGDIRMRCTDPPGAPGFWSAMAGGRWEAHTIAALVALTGPGTIFVDIGGWIGPTALIAAGRGAQVHSFEPDPKAVELFRQNLALNPDLAERVTLYDFAVGRSNGMATLTSGTLGNSESSLAKRHGEQAKVTVRAVRELGREPWFDHADVVKLDVEGSEYDLMSDLAPVLARRLPHFLLSTHTGYVNDRAPAGPKWVRRAAKAIRLASHARLVEQLRFYPFWYVPAGGHWRRISRTNAAKTLVGYRDQEFLLANAPLPQSIVTI